MGKMNDVKNVIVSALFSENHKGVVAGEKAIKRNINYDIYVKNVIVSLCSAKLLNPIDDVLLITNTQLPVYYQRQLVENGVKIIIVPFEYYVMPPSFIWRFAFYKLNVLKFLLEKTEYDNILLLDTDTYHAKSLEWFWKECEANCLHMYSTRHSLNHDVRAMYINDFRKIATSIGCNGSFMFDQWGGEFVGCNRFVLQKLVCILDSIYDSYKSINFNISHQSGDELFLSIASLIIPTKDAGAYIERFWTQRFYLSSTKWYYDPVAIWHIPAEKKYGMLALYNYYMKHGRFPNVRKSAYILNLPRSRRISMVLIKTLIKKLWENLKI